MTLLCRYPANVHFLMHLNLVCSHHVSCIHSGCDIYIFQVTLLINKYEFKFLVSGVNVGTGTCGYAVRCWIHLFSVGTLNYPFDDHCRRGGEEEWSPALRFSLALFKSRQSSFGLHLITKIRSHLPQSLSPIYRHLRSFLSLVAPPRIPPPLICCIPSSALEVMQTEERECGEYHREKKPFHITSHSV